MMRRTATAAVTVAALAGLALSACGSSGDATATGAKAGGGAWAANQDGGGADVWIAIPDERR